MLTGRSDVAFISPPFFPAYCPSYAVEYLAAICRQNGLSAETHHLHHDFGANLLSAGALTLYDALVSQRYLGDMLVLARWQPKEAGRILAELPRVVGEASPLAGASLNTFFSVWNYVHSGLLEGLLRNPPRVVALSATHYQLVASLWLAHEIRRADPSVAIVLGGYLGTRETCRDLLDGHEALDAVVFGEGDQVVVETIRRLSEERKCRDVVEGQRTIGLRAVPDYTAFLQRVVDRGDDLGLVSLNYEASRGCYWDKCDFCNFNVAYGRFRRFDATQAVGEMSRLAATWGVRRFHLLDTSLPPSFARQCREATNPDWDVFVEIMADWKTEELALLRSFGVRRAQVGIESFSDSHLVSMRKGRTVANNAAVLEACQAADVKPVYGLLVGRPGDTPDHYRESAAFALANLSLPPPKYLSECDLRPGSPIFKLRAQLGAEIRFLGDAFERVLPQADHNCELRPSHVTWETLEQEDLRSARVELIEAVDRWQSHHA